jgi:hypothetical protein
VNLAGTFDGTTNMLYENDTHITPGTPARRILGLLCSVQIIFGRINRIAYLDEMGALWRRQQEGARRLRGFFARRRWTGRNWSDSDGFWILGR